ncbi:helix-turn-helix domain-containing protein [Blautia obeum]|uniref:helix-turn-helix domain-containing protein n=1 Tax=Blautia obeum TaxID=40520 RepID=UPI003D0598C2
MTVGENIKRIRKEKGLTQKRLGELCGINEAQIRRYELGGKNSNPKIETVQRIAEALEVNISDLITLDWMTEKIEDRKIIREYNALDIAIKDNLDKMNNSAKKKVFDYTKDLIENPKNWKDQE